jgi:hypothetical protein
MVADYAGTRTAHFRAIPPIQRDQLLSCRFSWPKKPALCLDIILVALAFGSEQNPEPIHSGTAMGLNFIPDEALVLISISCSSSLSY